MSEISQIRSRLEQALNGQAGMSALHASFPNDFEYYMCALELVKYDGSTIDYFVFPINPSLFSISNMKAPSVEKTMGGVVISNNPTFTPIDINISGNFGRSFKVLVGKNPDVSVAQYSTASGSFLRESMQSGNSGKFLRTMISTRVKNGYGATKILESICDKSHGEIDGRPNQLYLYNPAFNSNYIVKVMGVTFKMDQSTNMVWHYDMRLKAVAPMEVVLGAQRTRLGALDALSRGAIQKTVNEVSRLAVSIGSRSISGAINSAR